MRSPIEVIESDNILRTFYSTLRYISDTPSRTLVYFRISIFDVAVLFGFPIVRFNGLILDYIR